METKFLDHLARQLKLNKSPSCCRAINRILAGMEKRCEADEYTSQTEAENAFRKFVEDESVCQKPTKAKAAAQH